MPKNLCERGPATLRWESNTPKLEGKPTSFQYTSPVLILLNTLPAKNPDLLAVLDRRHNFASREPLPAQEVQGSSAGGSALRTRERLTADGAGVPKGKARLTGIDALWIDAGLEARSSGADPTKALQRRLEPGHQIQRVVKSVDRFVPSPKLT